MANVIGTIVDKEFRLIGLKLEGTPKEFGEADMGGANITREYLIRTLGERRFRNGQIDINGMNITERNGFRLKNLPCEMYTDGKRVAIQNEMSLASRIVNNGEVLGFDVMLGGKGPFELSYKNTIIYAKRLKCIGFMVKTNEKGREFICGSKGNRLENLPEREYGAGQKAKKAPIKSVEKTAVKAGALRELGLLELIDFVKENNGEILKFNDTEYKVTGDKMEEADGNFHEICAFEKAKPYAGFKQNALNVNLPFTKYGSLTLPIDAEHGYESAADITVGKFATKTIFKGGKVNLSKIGLVIPKGKLELLGDVYLRALAVAPVTDEKVLRELGKRMMLDKYDVVSVNVERLDILNMKNASSYILSGSNLETVVEQLAMSKIKVKFINAVIKKLAEDGFKPEEKRSLTANAKMYGAERLILNHVDPYTDMYSGTGKFTSSGNRSDAQEEISIEYRIDALNKDTITVKQILERVQDGKMQFMKYLVDISGSNCGGREKFVQLAAEKAKAEKLAGELEERLAKHRIAMWISCDKMCVHKADKGNWEYDGSSRKKGEVYQLKGTEVIMILNGISIAR